MHLENEMIKVVDFEKIILQMKEEYSQLEKENQVTLSWLAESHVYLDAGCEHQDAKHGEKVEHQCH
jgi:hypothetical protein